MLASWRNSLWKPAALSWMNFYAARRQGASSVFGVEIRGGGSMERPSFLLQEVEKQRRTTSGKYCNIIRDVLSSPKVLAVAYHRIRGLSSTEMRTEPTQVALLLERIAAELKEGAFDVQANCYSLASTKELEMPLLLPNLHLKIVQMAMKMVLEIIYESKFLPISHGCRPGKGRHTLLKDIKYAFREPAWFISMKLHRQFDSENMKLLISILQQEIHDCNFFGLLWQMFHADVLHLEVGGYPKGCGLPQEGILSSILINIYMDCLDKKATIIHEVMKQEHGSFQQVTGLNSNLEMSFRMHFFRYVDEIFVAVRGCKKQMLHVRDQITTFLTTDLCIQVDSTSAVSDKTVIFGVEVWSASVFEDARSRSEKTNQCRKRLINGLRTLALKKQMHWEAGLRKMGSNLLIHALKDPKYLTLENGQLSDQYVKRVLAAWVKSVPSEIMHEEEQSLRPGKFSKGDLVLQNLVCKYLPQDLTDAYVNFQLKAKEYITSEDDALLLQRKRKAVPIIEEGLDRKIYTKLLAPIEKIQQTLSILGLIDEKGNPQPLLALMAEHDVQIVQWYTCLAKRWLSFFSCCDNFSMVKGIVKHQIRWSCIQTVAAKYKVSETDIIRKFTLSLIITRGNDGLPANLFPSELAVYSCRRTFLIDPSPVGSFLNVAFIGIGDRGKSCNVLTCKETITNYYLTQHLPVGNWAYYSAAPHSAFLGKRLSLCNKHLKDLNLGVITLQALDLNHYAFKR